MRLTNLVIGTAALAILTAALVGMLAAQKMRGAQARSPLRIVFEGSAFGLRKGGAVNFDGVPAGEITSITLQSPRKIVAMTLLDNTVPIRKDTVVGVEFQGLTGLAAISLVGGASSAPPVPVDEDGIPVLTADWSEQQSMTDTLHTVDKLILGNEAAIKDTLTSLESSSESLKTKGQAIDGVIAKAEDALSGIGSAIDKVDRAMPGAVGDNRLEDRIRSVRELADSFRRRSAAAMEEARQTLLDVSDAANKMSQKLDPQTAPPAAAPRRDQSRRP